MKRQLHWSHISMFTRCPEQYRLRYLEGIRLAPGSGAVCGTGMHRAAELDLTRKMETGELAPEEEVTEAARDAVVKTFDDPEAITFTEDEKEAGVGAVKAKAIDDAVRCAALHHAELAPQANPRHVERKWVLDVPGFPFDLAGTIDCDDGFVVWDWKTSGKTPAADDAITSGQVTMYSMAKWKLDGILPAFRMGFAVKLKTPKAVVLETRRTEADFIPLVRAMERIADAIDKEIFTFAAWMSPRPWWCSPNWCGYYGICEGVCGKTSVAI